jgi:hypothetical protein
MHDGVLSEMDEVTQPNTTLTPHQGKLTLWIP